MRCFDGFQGLAANSSAASEMMDYRELQRVNWLPTSGTGDSLSDDRSLCHSSAN